MKGFIVALPSMCKVSKQCAHDLHLMPIVNTILDPMLECFFNGSLIPMPNTHHPSHILETFKWKICELCKNKYILFIV